MNNGAEAQAYVKRGSRVALGVGLAGLAVCVAYGLGGRQAAMQAYLLAYLYWVAIALGALSLLLLQHVTGGRWGMAIRRLLEAAASTLPYLALLFIPIALQLHQLYPWADPAGVEDHAIAALIAKKAAYLNPMAFTIRAAVYFAVWVGISRLIIRWSHRLDAANDPAILKRMQAVSAPALVAYALTVTFAAFDWGMSLDPEWFSTMYGVIFAVGGALAAMALCIVTLARIAPRGPHAQFMTAETSGDLGNLMLAFTMFWTYVSLSQFLIIWSAHLPEERPWYFVRMHGGWQWVGFGLLGMAFALPFLMLLSRARKRDLGRLAKVALFVLVMRAMDLFWIVEPSFSDALRLRVVDIAAMAGLGGLWLFLYLRALAAAPLLPVRLAEASAGGQHHG